MRIFVWAFRLVIFLVLLTLAARNLHPVTLELFADYVVEAPFVVMLLSAFVLGVLASLAGLGLLLLRQRRDILRLSADLHTSQAAKQTSALDNPLLPPQV
jgi:uncharacterized integral membrane protein